MIPTDFTFVGKHYAARLHEKMREVLMNPDAPGPAVHYYMIRGGETQRNITVWEPGLVGGEYIKTYGHYHVGDLDETYWVLLGEGLILKQKMTDDPTVVEEFSITRVTQGDSVFLAPGYGHLAINIGPTFFVTADDSPVRFDDPDPAGLPGHADYEPVRKTRGFAYYVIEQNGTPALVRNTNYTEIKHEDLGGLPLYT
ncbi:MAG: glucose-6-phosphate isomerase family protein [Patescibacteria group bacterium]